MRAWAANALVRGVSATSMIECSEEGKR